MTGIVDIAPTTEPLAVIRRPVRPHTPWWQDDGLRSAVFVAGLFFLAAATAALRLFHQASAYDLFVDEIQYADVANSFAAGNGPELFGGPFFLHPPLFFAYLGLLQGGPVDRMTVEHVLALRHLVVPFAVINSLLAVAIARRFTGRTAALVAGALYALDPFIVRFDSRVMLEAPTLTATLAGLLAVLVAVDRTDRSRTLLLGLAGLAFGVAVMTKSTAALITTAPLLLMCVVRGGPRRREAAVVIGVQCLVYACYVGWTAVIGHFGDWFTMTLNGVVRAAARPQTGFTATGAPSFLDRLVARFGQFGASYLLIVVALVAIAVFVYRDVALRRRTGRHAFPVEVVAATRTFTCWLGGVLLAVAWTAAFGELEEQTFYLMVVPSTIVIVVLAAGTRKVVGRAVLWAAAAGVLAWSAWAWVGVHTTADDAYARMEAHLVPLGGPGSAVALGESTAQFVTPNFGIVLLDGATPPPGARYGLVSTALSRLGLSPVTPEEIAALDRRYPVLYLAAGRTVGELKLYDFTHPRP